MIKVLFFTNIPSPYRVDFFNELGKMCDLTVLYERCDADDRDQNWMKLNENYYYKSVFLRGKKIGADSAFCPEVMKYWKDSKYDIKIVGDYATPTGIFSCLYMHMRGITYGIECDGGFLREGERRIVKTLKTLLLSNASYIFSPGKMTDQYLKSYGVKMDKIYRYPFTSLNKKDIENARRDKNRKEDIKKKLGIEEDKIVLSVGQMIYRKGFDILLESAKELKKNVGIYIVGGNPPKEYIIYVKKNRLNNVHFVGFQKKEVLAKYYLMADIFAFPTREDIWGLVIGEAMSFGLPVITTEKCVAGVELLEKGGGQIIPSENTRMLVTAINRILDNEELQKQYSEESVDIIKDYTIEKMAEVHFNILKGIV